MKYLKSTTQRTYIFEGRFVPACVTDNNATLALTDKEFIHFSELPVVKSLLNAGAVIALDEEPVNPTKQNQQLSNHVAELTMKNTVLQEKLAKLEHADDEIASLKAALKAQQDKYAELEKEAKAKIAELSKKE